MCGIVGYTGNDKATPYLIDGLEKLEYRGYDSAGIAVIEKEKIIVTKRKGRLNNLVSAVAANRRSNATTGIGHTRWATHGKPDEVNAHPHLSMSGLFSVVHNGIIENFASLKNELENDGFIFVSETDTEVIANLLEKNYDGDLVSTVRKTTERLEGSYALAILCSDFPETLVLTRWASPLIIGKNSNGVFVSSDLTAMVSFTRDVYRPEGREIVIADKSKINFFNSDGKEIQKEAEHISIKTEDAQKSGFEHFMLKEIFEQPKAISDTICQIIKSDNKIEFEKLNLTDSEIRDIKRIIITACGSAYHAGLNAKYIIEEMTGLPVSVDIASEFRYTHSVIDKNCLVIIISQSGETADSLAALRLANEKGARTLGIVNVVGSSIATESQNVIYTHAGPEIAVATTKAYSTQLVVLYLLSAFIAEKSGLLNRNDFLNYISEIQKLPSIIEQTTRQCKDEIEKLSEYFVQLEHAYFIGRNLDYACAAEASLKMKEISYIHSEAYPAGELKHGTISLIEKGTIVVALASCDNVFQKTMSNIRELKARGARVLVVSTKKHRKDLVDVDAVVTIPNIHSRFSTSAEVIPMQLLGYYTAKKRGCDIDKPRNLAKSVTVE